MNAFFITLLPLLSGLFWGTPGPFVRYLDSNGIDQITILSSRLLVTVLILLVIILIKDASLLRIKKKDIILLTVNGLNGFLGLNIFYNIAITRLSLSFAAVLLTMSAITILPMAAIIFKEKITITKICCSIVAIIGCTFMSGLLEPDAGVAFSIIGIFAGLMSAICYSIYSILSKSIDKCGYHSLTISFYLFAVCMPFTFPFTDWGALWNFTTASPYHVLFLLAQSLICSVLPFLFFGIAIRYMDSGKATILSTCEPVSALLLGIFLYKEYPTMLSICGILLCMGALIFLSISSRPNKRKENPQCLD